jgi:RHS repeat-associated protein
VSIYDRGGWLARVEYAKRAGAEQALATARVVFTTQLRCVWPGWCPAPTVANASWYPDVPLDLTCPANYCTKYAPSFWVDQMLAHIDTQVFDGGGWRTVDRVSATMEWPDPDGEQIQPAQLWLRELHRTGSPGAGEVVFPPVRFESGAYLDNRADDLFIGYWRVSEVNDDIGGRVAVTYGQPHPCVAQPPASGWGDNAQDCYAQWTVVGDSEGFGTFNKFLVTQTEVSDLVGGSPTIVRQYQYLTNPEWHWDPTEVIPAARRAWTQWRGHAWVRVWTDPSGPTPMVEDHGMFTGVHGDRTNRAGTEFKQRVIGAEADQYFQDDNWLAGREFEVRAYNGQWNLETFTLRYYTPAVTANAGVGVAYRIDERRVVGYARAGGGGFAVRDTRHTPTGDGLAYLRWEQGDPYDGGVDDVCAVTYYWANPALFLLDRAVDVQLWDGPATVDGSGYPTGCTGPLVDREVAFYDGGVMPVHGNPTTRRTYVDAGTYHDTTITYDAYGRPTTVDGPRVDVADVTVTGYDPTYGYANLTRDATGRETFTVMDPGRWQPLTVTDRNTDAGSASDDLTVAYAYDGAGRVTVARAPGDPSPWPATVTFEYGLSKTAPSWVRTSRLQTSNPTVRADTWVLYDGFGRERETQQASPAGTGRVVSATVFDTRGLVARAIPAFHTAGSPGVGLVSVGGFVAPPSETRTTYDAVARPTVSQRYANGAAVADHATASTYSARTLTVDTPTSAATTTVSDAFGRTVSVQAFNDTPSAWVTTSTYTPRGELATVTDPGENITTNAYDWAGRLLTVNDPDAGITAYTYDPAGNVVMVDDGRTGATDVKVWTNHDVLSRPTVTYTGPAATSTPAVSVREAEWVWDAPGEAGQLDRSVSWWHSGGADHAFTIDTTGYTHQRDVTGVTYTIPAVTGIIDGALAGTYTFGYGYDSARRRTSVSYPAAGGQAAETVTTTYTPLGYASTLAGSDVYVSASGYQPDGRLVSRTLGGANPLTRTYTWEPATGRLATQAASLGGSLIQHDSFTWSPDGNLTTITSDPAGTVNDERQCFGYDSRSRLTSAYTTPTLTGCGGPQAGGPAAYAQTYSLDGIGNLTTRTDTGTPTVYTYAQACTIGSTNYTPGPHAPTHVGANTYCYLDNGALARRVVAGQTQTLTWDPQGRLASFTKGSNTARYVYDPTGQRLVQSIPSATTIYLAGLIELKKPSSGAVTADRYYTLANTTVAFRDDASVYYLLGNHQGSAALTVKASSGVVKRQLYHPYGGTRADGTFAMPHGFLNQPTDDFPTLTYLNHRYHDPTTGLFTSVDPLVSKTGDPYLYAAGNPTTLSDPSGLDPDTDARIRYRVQSQTRYWLSVTSQMKTQDGMVGAAGAREAVWMRLSLNFHISQLSYIASQMLLNGAPAWAAEEFYQHPRGYLPVDPYGEFVWPDSGSGVSFGLTLNAQHAGAAKAIQFYAELAAWRTLYDGIASIGAPHAATNTVRSTSIVDDVIAETQAGARNLTSRYTLTADEALTAGERWVGSGYTEIGKPGSGVFRSADGTRQFRIDNGSITGAHSPGVPHVHLETIAPGSKVPVVNNHIPIAG